MSEAPPSCFANPHFSLCAQVACSGKGFLRKGRGRTQAALLSLTACWGLPRAQGRCWASRRGRPLVPRVLWEPGFAGPCNVSANTAYDKLGCSPVLQGESKNSAYYNRVAVQLFLFPVGSFLRHLGLTAEAVNGPAPDISPKSAPDCKPYPFPRPQFSL